MKNKLKLIILYSTVIILTILYILSFTQKRDRRKSVKTALVNSKNLDSIYKIELKNNNELLELEKINDLWFLDAYPADSERVKAFLKDLTQIRSLYKLKDNLSRNTSYGLNDGSEFILRYYYNDTAAELIFGKNDFSQTSRYLMTGKSTAIYELDNSLDKYLSCSRQLWADPYLISQNILGKIEADLFQSIKVSFQNQITYKNPEEKDWIYNINKLLALRHGAFDNAFNEGLIEMKLEIELGNKNQIILEIASAENKQEYFVKSQYFNNTQRENYTTYSKISLWTYNKIKEIML